MFLHTLMATYTRLFAFVSLVLITAIYCTPVAKANKKFRSLKAAIKTGQNLDAAIRLVSELESDSTIVKIQDKVQLAQYGFDLYTKQFERENELNYLKRSYDTVRYFNAIYGMSTYAARCYALETQPDDRGRAKIQHSPTNHSKLSRIATNLSSAAIFHYNKQDHHQAARFFARYFTLNESPLFQAYGKFKYTQPLSSTAYIAAHTYAALDSLSQTLYYGQLALADTTHRIMTYRLLANVLYHATDTTQYINTLQEALTLYPQDTYFFSHLSDAYLAQGHYTQVLQMADSLTMHYPKQSLYLYVKSVALLKLQRYKECITFSEQVLASDSANDSIFVDAYYNIGYSYYMQAESLPNNALRLAERQKNLKARNALYAAARPSLEIYRQRRKEQRELWYPLLYTIYYNLNLGQELQDLEENH